MTARAARYERPPNWIAELWPWLFILAILAAMAIAAILYIDRSENRGLSDAQLERIANECDARASLRSARRGVPYDEVFDRCEQMEKTIANPDPFPPN
jgi:hypothetical protein